MADDIDRGRLLQLPEIAEITTLSVDSLRWHRHAGTGPRTFKLGRRVVAYESDVRDWINEMRGREHPESGAIRATRKLITPEFLEEVAKVYRENNASGAPTKAVAEHFGVASATASIYVKKARESNRDMGDNDVRARYPTPDLIKEVAAIYRVHFSTGAVAKHFNFTRSTALELLSLASTAGLLDDAAFAYADAQP